jgi:hypothetical protein
MLEEAALMAVDAVKGEHKLLRVKLGHYFTSIDERKESHAHNNTNTGATLSEYELYPLWKPELTFDLHMIFSENNITDTRTCERYATWFSSCNYISEVSGMTRAGALAVLRPTPAHRYNPDNSQFFTGNTSRIRPWHDTPTMLMND